MQVELIVELRKRRSSSYLAREVERAYSRLPMVGEFVWLFEDSSPRNLSLPVSRVVWRNDGAAQLFFHHDSAGVKGDPLPEQRLIDGGYVVSNQFGVADSSTYRPPQR